MLNPAHGPAPEPSPGPAPGPAPGPLAPSGSGADLRGSGHEHNFGGGDFGDGHGGNAPSPLASPEKLPSPPPASKGKKRALRDTPSPPAELSYTLRVSLVHPD